MDLKILTVCVGGEFKVTNGYCEYVGDLVSKAFMIDSNIDLEALMTMISNRFDICLKTYELRLSHLHPVQKLRAPFTISKDDDLKAFLSINEVPQVDWSLPLHVETKKRMNVSEIAKAVQQTSGITVSSEYLQSTSVDDTLAIVPTDVASEDTQSCNDEDQSAWQIENEIDEMDFIYVGQMFSSKKHLQAAVANQAVNENFQFRTKKSNQTKYKVVCIDASCKWSVMATRVKNSRNFEVRKLNGEHTCSFSLRCKEHRKPSYQSIAAKMKIRYAS